MKSYEKEHRLPVHISRTPKLKKTLWNTIKILFGACPYCGSFDEQVWSVKWSICNKCHKKY